MDHIECLDVLRPGNGTPMKGTRDSGEAEAGPQYHPLHDITLHRG